MVKDMLSSRLNTVHNLWYFSDLMRRIRAAIAHGTFETFREAFYRAHAREVSDVTVSAEGDAETSHDL
jgi:queuine tRNA-ribosyltransferase